MIFLHEVVIYGFQCFFIPFHKKSLSLIGIIIFLNTMGTGNANESYKVNDLNIEADATADDEDDDDVDWEEG